jgi:hypothetical protein
MASAIKSNLSKIILETESPFSSKDFKTLTSSKYKDKTYYDLLLKFITRGLKKKYSLEKMAEILGWKSGRLAHDIKEGGMIDVVRAVYLEVKNEKEEAAILRSIDEDIDALVAQVPDLYKRILRTMLEDFHAKPSSSKFNAVEKFILSKIESKQVEQTNSQQQGNYRRPFHRPDKLTDFQKWMLLQFHTHKIIFLIGPRRTAKTVLCWIFIHEYLHAEPMRKAIFIGATESSSMEIVNDRWYDKLLSGPPEEQKFNSYIGEYQAKKIVHPNGSKFSVRNSKTSGSKGLDAEIVQIDEFDQVLIDNPRVVADAVATALSHPNMKLIFTANQPLGEDMGVFDAFRNIFEDPMYWKRKYKDIPDAMIQEIIDDIFFYELTPEHAPFSYGKDTRTGNYYMVHAIQSESMGGRYADSQLGNKKDETGVHFPRYIMEPAMEGYDDFCERMGYDEPDDSVLAFDPTGGEHSMGISAFGLWRTQMFEYDTRELLGKIVLDDAKVVGICMEMIRQFRIKCVVGESNSGGLKILDMIRDRVKLGQLHGEYMWIKDPDKDIFAQNFGKDENNTGHIAFIKVARGYFLGRNIFLMTEKILTELGRYNPKKSRSEKDKGNIADSTLHAIWRLYQRILEGQKNKRRRRRTIGGL